MGDGEGARWRWRWRGFEMAMVRNEMDWSARCRVYKARRQVPSLRRASWAFMQVIGNNTGKAI